MKRSKFSLSHYKLLTCELGKLIPISCFEVLPGDTVQQATSALIRVTPLVAPVMHPVHVRIHHWYVPLRIIWQDFEDFITGGPDGMNASVPPYYSNAVVSKGDLMEYLGVPIGSTQIPVVSALPIRAYQKIWSEWYRDQDLQAEPIINTTSGQDSSTTVGVQPVAWEKDYFTSARPWTQKGPDVSLPLGTVAPVIPAGTGIPTFTIPGGAGNPKPLAASTGGTDHAMWGGGAPGVSASAAWSTSSLQADLTGATATNINAVRRAFALQRYEEARARYGSRYTEYLRYLGVRSSDARLQRPEYLGGGKQTIQFSEVLQTAPNDTDSGVGKLAGHGIGAMRSNRYRRFFEEHGLVLSLLSVKPKTMYVQGLSRMWTRRVKEEYFQRELQHIGQQEIYNREVYVPHTTPAGIFGYQDRYDEYRRAESGVAGDFRDTLDHWHYARIFAANPALNASFIAADPTKRVYQEQTAHPLWIMTNHSIQARRMVARQGSSHIF